MIDVDADQYRKHEGDFRPVAGGPQNQESLLKLADLVSDWKFFRFYEGSVNTGSREAKYGTSESLGIIRPLTIREFHGLNSCSADHYASNERDFQKQERDRHQIEMARIFGKNIDRYAADCGISYAFDGAKKLREACMDFAKTDGLKALSCIMGRGMAAEEFFLSARDRQLTRSLDGIKVLGAEISRHLDENRLSFVSFGDDRIALMFISPEPDGFEGRVRRELLRDLPEDDASSLAQVADLIEDEGQFIAKAVLIHLQKQVEMILGPSDDVEVDLDPSP
jgi:hypothetical protein